MYYSIKAIIVRKTIVAALSENHVIGANNEITWHMPADTKHYHDTVKGKVVIMGRKTFVSPGGHPAVQKIIMITRQVNYPLTENEQKFVEAVSTIPTAFEKAKSHGVDEVFILGGGMIYQETIGLADKMILTYIKTNIQYGEAFFPEIELSHWQITEKRCYKADLENPFDYDIVTYCRK